MYPYLPENRKILYVNANNKFMKEATKLLNSSGCAKQPTAAVIVKKKKIIGRGVNAGKKIEICPRITHQYPTGQGYELCKNICQQKGHAEIMAILDAQNSGYDTRGANLYLDGHWWICESCWKEIIKAGIAKIFLRKDSMALYKR